MTLFKDRKICNLLSNMDKGWEEGRGGVVTQDKTFPRTNATSVERYSPDDEKTKLGPSDSISSCITQVSIKQRNDRESQTDADLSVDNAVEYQKEVEKPVQEPETRLVKVDENGIRTFQSSNLVIFDYDDTILPTTALSASQKPRFSAKLTEPVIQELRKLSKAIVDNLTIASQYGTIVIVTNASYDWIAQSLERYLPEVGEFLIKFKVRIISARERFGRSLLAQRHWKYFIFIDLIEEQFIRQLKTGEPFSVISIGDGIEEREACIKLVGIFKNQGWTFKNLKFLSQPSYNCLTLQHVLLHKSFKNFVEIESSADLCIQFDKVNN